MKYGVYKKRLYCRMLVVVTVKWVVCNGEAVVGCFGSLMIYVELVMLRIGDV